MNSEFDRKTIGKIARNKIRLERKLKVKLTIKGSRVNIKGRELDVFIAGKVLDAASKNFSIDTALLLCGENYLLEDISIKSITKKNTKIVKARIIGKKGKILKTLQELSDCYITLHNNTVSILGTADKIKEVVTAMESLIRGAKQTNIFAYLEKHRSKPAIEDLGLKTKE